MLMASNSLRVELVVLDVRCLLVCYYSVVAAAGAHAHAIMDQVARARRSGRTGTRRVRAGSASMDELGRLPFRVLLDR